MQATKDVSPAHYCFFDEERFMALTMGEPTVISCTAQAFLDHTPIMINQLIESVKKEDREKSKFFIHKIKSSAALVGAQNILLNLNDLENNASVVSMRALLHNVLYIKELLTRLLSEIELFLKNQFVPSAA